MGKLTNKVALITGGAKGMGANHARRFIDEGAKVYFTDIEEDEGRKLAEALGERAVFFKQDVSEEADWKAVTGAIDAAEGRLDILVNNAGIMLSKAIGECTLDEYMWVVKTNQVSVFLGLTYALPLLKKGHHPSVVNISSNSGLAGFPTVAAYASSKYAIRALTQVAANEFAQHGIRVNSVHPGLVATPMVLDEQSESSTKRLEIVTRNIPLGRISTPDEQSNVVLFLASDDASFCTGSEFLVDGGALLPK